MASSTPASSGPTTAEPVVLEWWATPRWSDAVIAGVVVASILYFSEHRFAVPAVLMVLFALVAAVDSRVRVTLDEHAVTVRTLFSGPRRLERRQIVGYYVDPSTLGTRTRVVVLGAPDKDGRVERSMEIGGRSARITRQRVDEVTAALREWGVLPLLPPSGD